MKKNSILGLISVLVSLFLLIAVRSALGSGSVAQAAPAVAQSAHVAVQFAPSEQIVRKIHFDAPVNGLQALDLSGIPYETYDYGGGLVAVCSINGIGCPATAADCFCSSKFWNYEYWDGGQWQGYPVGPGSSTVSDGSVEGWRWSEWGVGSLPPAPQLLATQKALNWLAGGQAADGGYGPVSSSVESLLSIGANGLNASPWRAAPAQISLMGYLLKQGHGYSQQGAGQAGKLAVGLAGAQGCWPLGAKKPGEYYNPNTGKYADGAGLQAWSMLGVRALSETVPLAATQALKGLQQSDGGWEFVPGGFGGGTDINTTALALQALIAVGEPVTSTSIISGVNYLKLSQNDDGGFPYNPDSPWGTDSDANSTAYAIQAILAAGQDPSTWVVTDTQNNPHTPISYLMSLQLADGSFEWMSGLGSNQLATQQAIPALLQRTFPLIMREIPACPAFFIPFISR